MKNLLVSTVSRPSSPLWCSVALLQVVDAVVYPLLHAPIKHFYPMMYLVGCIMNVLFITWLWAVYTALPRRARTVAAVAISLLLTALSVVNAMVYREMGEYLSMYMLAFVTADPQYIANFAVSYLLDSTVVWFVLLWALLFALWYPRATVHRSTRRTAMSLAAALVLPVLYLIPLNQVNVHGRQAILTTTAATGLAVRDFVRFAETPQELCASRHLPVYSSPATINDEFNIVLIVNESWGRHGLPFYGAPDTAMPFLSQWVDADSARFFVFRRAYTNSSATDVSIPSLFTGVGPEESSKKLHAMPFVWDWAKAAGMSTLFVSAQRFTWSRFDRFFFSPGPDIRYTAEDMNMPQINDTGVDELFAAEAFCRALQRLPNDRRFFAVYNSNAMHMPFQQTSSFLSEQPSHPVPYYNAASLLDRSFGRIYEILRDRGDLARTLIVFTSDHGEYLTNCHDCTPRITAFNKTVMTIPFLVYIPASWLEDRSDLVAALRTNCDRPVANIDVAPTIAEVLDLTRHEENLSIAMEFAGRPLTKPIPEDRMVLSLNTNDIRRWDPEGFSIYSTGFHFLFSTLNGAQYYDLARDPDETADVWPSLPAARRDSLLAFVQSVPHLKRIYGRATALADTTAGQ